MKAVLALALAAPATGLKQNPVSKFQRSPGPR